MMKNVMRNTGRILMRNKSFIYLITGMPVLLFLLMSVLLPYTELHSIAVINHTDDLSVEHALYGIEGIDIQEIREENITESIIQGTIELAVVIDRDPVADEQVVQLIGTGDSEIYPAVELAVSTGAEAENEGIVSVNSADRGKYSLSNTSAFMLYKFIEGGSFLGALIIMDRKKRVKDRIVLSGIKPVSYIGGMTAVYLAFTFIGTLLYYLTARVMHFDFGMRHSTHYLLMIFLANVFAASFFVFASSFIKREEGLGSITSFVIMPMAFFAGMFFPFHYMPEVFQKVASFFPQRWIAHGIEQIQRSGALSSALRDIVLLAILSAILFVVGAYRNSRKAAA